METNIGDDGNKLSGVRKQRVSIAHAVLKNPPTMILDEATSALDTESGNVFCTGSFGKNDGKQNLSGDCPQTVDNPESQTGSFVDGKRVLLLSRAPIII